MVDVPVPQDGNELQEFVEPVFETVARPVENASLWYILYYLDRIENEQAAEFDFQQRTDLLHRGFFRYGLYAVAREASHVTNFHPIEGTEMRTFLDSNSLGVIRGYVREWAPEEKVADVVRFIEAAQEFPGGATRDANEQILKSVFEWMETEFNGLSEPGRFLDTMEVLMDDSPQADPGSAFSGRTGWLPQYNGEGWAGIVKHLTRRETLPEVSWVDQTWAIEHNNGNWFDKLRLSRDEQDRILDSELSDALNRSVFDRREHLSVLLRILDANKRGDMLTVLGAALLWNDQVGINLARYRPILRNEAVSPDNIHLRPEANIGRVHEKGPVDGYAILNAQNDKLGEIAGANCRMYNAELRDSVSRQPREEIAAAAVEEWTETMKVGCDEIRIKVAVDNLFSRAAEEMGYEPESEPPFDLVLQD